jgi:hypothetical protein
MENSPSPGAAKGKESAMRFMMLVIPRGYGKAEPGFVPDSEMVRKTEAYNNSLRQAGALIGLDGLHPQAAGARIGFRKSKATVTRGPFAATRDALGGFWMIRAQSLDEAIDWAARAPMADGDVIEVRPVQETEHLPAEVRKALAAASKPPPLAQA